MSSVTPMMRQYLEIKSRYPDAILFFRLGDFYEMFLDDAVTAAKILDITLTSRNKGSDDEIPLCGIPHHSCQPVITSYSIHYTKLYETSVTGWRSYTNCWKAPCRGSTCCSMPAISCARRSSPP